MYGKHNFSFNTTKANLFYFEKSINFTLDGRKMKFFKKEFINICFKIYFSVNKIEKILKV